VTDTSDHFLGDSYAIIGGHGDIPS
jgi:hypothetical protein